MTAGVPDTHASREKKGKAQRQKGRREVKWLVSGSGCMRESRKAGLLHFIYEGIHQISISDQ